MSDYILKLEDGTVEKVRAFNVETAIRAASGVVVAWRISSPWWVEVEAA